MEGMSNGCFHSPYPYALKHNPFAYYGSSCPSEVVPFTQFAADMSGTVPRFAWITPDLCHDGHDCTNAIADTWLAQTVPTILASNAWKDNGVLIITWDEGEDSANSVLTLVVQPNPGALRSARSYNHYSLLATIEDKLGVARLGLAAQATPMTDLLPSSATPKLRDRVARCPPDRLLPVRDRFEKLEVDIDTKSRPAWHVEPAFAQHERLSDVTVVIAVRC